MPIEFAKPELTELSPRIAVVGVGGAGCNAVNNMISTNLQGVEFIVANTDAQSLANSLSDNQLQLGVETTSGLGAGAQPQVGQSAAEESIEQIEAALNGCHMAFITAGMGGGTGTGAAPVIAQTARAKGILTVGVVTKPFQFEGGRRMKIAEAGIEAMADNVDTLIIIPNQNLFRVANERTTFAEAFTMADEVLHSGVRGVTDLMVMPGLINLDFADVRTVMSEMGKAMMGTGEAEGENRAVEAASSAIANPLLEDASLKGAKGVIINVTGGMDMTLYEVDEAVNMVREQADPDALIVFGSAFNDNLAGRLRVSVVATGIDGGELSHMPEPVRRPKADPAPEPKDEAAPDTESATEHSRADAGAEPADMNAAADGAVETGIQLDVAPAANEDALEARALAGQGDSFVAAAPAMPREAMETLAPANQEDASNYTGGSNDKVVTEPPAEPAQPAEAEDKSKPTLFRMMTSVVRTKEKDAAAVGEAPVHDTEAREIDRDPGRVRLAPSAAVSSEPDPAQRDEGAAHVEETPETERSSKTQLEIPSFLTRQQN